MQSAKAAFKIPLPRKNAITTDNKITGIEKIVSIIVDKHLSKTPPRYPLINPNGSPIPNDKTKENNTISIAILEPCKVLIHTSLPSLSVPQKCLKDGA